MLADLKPDLAAVIWDAGLPERRTQLQPQYKQHRDEMPDDLDIQQEPIQEIVPLLGVASLFLENTEADDLIASYVIEARKQEIECVVATNDKDILQLVREGVSIYSTAKADVGEGNGGFKLLGVPEVRMKWGVEPELIADVLALTGDSADNIPGVPGVGGKTAAKWINQYGSLDHLLKSDDLDPKVREKVEASRELIVANRQMVALDLDLPLPMPIPEMRVAPRYAELIESLRRCEFRSLTAEVEREAASVGAGVGRSEIGDGGDTGRGVEGSRTRDKSQKQNAGERGVEGPGTRDESQKQNAGERGVETPSEREGSPLTESLSDHLLPVSQTPTQGELF